MYRRVSTEEQLDSGLGLEAQLEVLTAAVTARAWVVVADAVDEGISGKTLDRPALRDALEKLDAGAADVLVVSKLDRLSRSMLDFCGLMARAERKQWSIVCLDVNVDTSTPSGELMAHMIAAFAQYERKLIAQRTREALHALKAQGQRLGRPVELDGNVRKRIGEMRSCGHTLAAIAEALGDDGTPTARGGHWHPSTVAAVLRSLDRDSEVTA